MAVKRKVLVVDDEPSVCEGIELVLAPAGFEVKKALKGEDAIKLIEREDFDVVLMDLIMPVMDGVEAFRRVREIDPRAKVLLCSGYSREERAEDLIAQGAVGFLEKPFDMSVLARTISALSNEAT